MNLEALAEQLASKWFFLAKPSSAEVLAALIKVRDAERERCAGIIQHGVKFTPAPKNQSVRNYITETCWMLEKAIRKGE